MLGRHDQQTLTSNRCCRSWSDRDAATLRTIRVRDGVSLNGRSPMAGALNGLLPSAAAC